MNVTELKQRLVDLQINPTLYAINEEFLKPNAHTLFKNYYKWEYFFLDEKGNRQDTRYFLHEEEACDFFLKRAESELNL